MENTSISIAAAAAITERSRRTWWRRIADGRAARLDNDAQGRAMLSMADVLPHICVPLRQEELDILAKADAGDAEAESDVGQFFLVARKPAVAAFWLSMAAHHGCADAMQWLGRCYVAGEGVPTDPHTGFMWIAKAAARGHVIACAQMQDSLRMPWPAAKPFSAPATPSPA